MGETHPPIRRGRAHWGPVRGTVDTSTVNAGGKPVEQTQPDNAATASEEQRVTEKENDQTSDEVTVETTSVFRADFLNELDAPAQAGTETAVSGVEGLPSEKTDRSSASSDGIDSLDADLLLR